MLRKFLSNFKHCMIAPRHCAVVMVIRRYSSSQVGIALSHHLCNIIQQHTTINDRLSSPGGLTPDEHKRMSKTLAALTPLVKLIKALEDKRKDIEELSDISKESGELGKMADEEIRNQLQEIKKLEDQIMKALIPRDEADENNAILEVRAGPGGQEASLFAYEIFSMYQRFSAFKKWKFEVMEIARSESGGYKEASASMSGNGVFGKMKFEVGVHRVQRVPVTEAMGRVHTSTMTVAVLPQPEEVDVVINPSELKLDTFRASGAGGQHVNTTDSAVRITHLPTGMVVSSQEGRSQFKNKAKAMQVLRARLYEIQRRQATSERDHARRKQIGTAERSEKIRTYNFPQDRVTDHRIGVSVHGIEGFLEGGAMLENMIDCLWTNDESQALQVLVNRYSATQTAS